MPVVERLRARYPHVRWIKEAGGIGRPGRPAEAGPGRDITVLSGDDCPHAPVHGGRRRGRHQRRLEPLPSARWAGWSDCALANDFAGAGRLHRRLYPVLQGDFHRAQSRADQGRPRPGRRRSPRAEVRLPLCEMTPRPAATVLERVLDGPGAMTAMPCLSHPPQRRPRAHGPGDRRGRAPNWASTIGAAVDAGDDPRRGVDACDVIVDFSSPRGDPRRCSSSPSARRQADRHRDDRPRGRGEGSAAARWRRGCPASGPEISRSG